MEEPSACVETEGLAQHESTRALPNIVVGAENTCLMEVFAMLLPFRRFDTAVTAASLLKYIKSDYQDCSFSTPSRDLQG